MRRATALLGLSLLPALGVGVYTFSPQAAAYLSEFGIEGMGVVSTRAAEAGSLCSQPGT